MRLQGKTPQSGNTHNKDQDQDQDQAEDEPTVCRTVLLILKRVVEECRADYSICSNMVIPL